MRAYSLNELFCLTRAELFVLHRVIVAELAPLPLDHPDREIALANLRYIRRALSRPVCAPR